MPDPTKVETLEDVLAGWLGARTYWGDAVRALRPLLTARIIRGPVCETCGGSGEVATGDHEHLTVEGHIGEVMARCPTCHGEPPPVSVVTAEAWEDWLNILAQGVFRADLCELAAHHRAGIDVAARQGISALLGGRVERAGEVVEVVTKRLPNWLVTFGEGENATKVLHDGDRIALLERRSRTS